MGTALAARSRRTRHAPGAPSLAGLLLGFACAACMESQPAAPELLAVVPGQGPDSASTAISVVGTGLRPRVLTDFHARGRSAVDDTWSARLGGAGLLDVQRLDEATLTATVPAGLAPGSHDLTVTDPYGRALVLAQAYRVVSATAPISLKFTTAPVTANAGACSGPVTVETRDILQRPALAASEIPVTLAASLPAVTFFDDAACARPVSGVTVRAGTVGATFHLLSRSAGALTTTALAPGLDPAEQTHTILPNAPTALAFVTPPRSVAVGACSQPVTLQVQDSLGNAAATPAPRAVTLQVSPAGLIDLRSDPACAMGLSAPTIGAGQSSLDLYLAGVAPGTSTLAATAPGLTGTSQAVVATSGAGGGTGGGAGGGAGGGTGGGTGGAGGAVVHEGTVGTTLCSNGAQTVITLTGAVPAGDTLIVRMTLRTVLSSTISAVDNRGNAYVVDVDSLNTSNPGGRMAFLRAPVTVPLQVGDLVTITHPDVASRAAAANRFSGMATSNAVVNTAVASGSSTTPGATVVLGEPAFVLGAVVASNSPTITDPPTFTALAPLVTACGGAQGNSRSAAGFRQDPAGATAYSPTMDFATSWAAAAVGYRAK